MYLFEKKPYFSFKMHITCNGGADKLCYLLEVMMQDWSKDN